ncbi:MAG: holo-ACP synthase [Nevskiales bacterium]
MSPVIYGVGTDLLRVSRMRLAYARRGERLPERILHPAERGRYRAGESAPNFLAKCFAVKEATVKALGTGFRGVGYNEVGWVQDERGKPELVFSSRLASWMRTRGADGGHVSLSDEGDYVLAFVILLRAG